MTATPIAFASPRVAPLLVSLALVGLLSACADSGSATSLNDAPVAREAAPTSKDFGDYVVHFNAVTSDQVSPQDAAKYGISRSRSKALLNVVILKKTGQPGHQPVSGNVSAKVSNLTGQLKKITLRKITEGEAIYYIGVVSVANKETLNVNIVAIPEGSDRTLEAKYQRQFFTQR